MPRPAIVVRAAVAGVLLTSLFAGVGTAAPRVFYLSPSGNDAASGSISQPWKSIYASLKKLRAGDTLYVRGGAYTFSGTHYTSIQGASGYPITIQNYPGETPVFTGTSTPANFLYFSGNAAYVTVRGLTVQGGGSTSYGSSLLGFIDNAHNIRIERMTLRGASNWTPEQHLAYVAASSVNDIVFKYTTFDGRGCACAGLLQFYHDPNAARIKVYANTFKNADQGIMVWAGVSGLRIWENKFASLRIGIRHHNSGGTSVTDNTGSSVRYGVYADSKRNLSTSGNDW